MPPVMRTPLTGAQLEPMAVMMPAPDPGPRSVWPFRSRTILSAPICDARCDRAIQIRGEDVVLPGNRKGVPQLVTGVSVQALQRFETVRMRIEPSLVMVLPPSDLNIPG